MGEKGVKLDIDARTSNVISIDNSSLIENLNTPDEGMLRPVDVQSVRLLTQGASAIDWRRLCYRNHDDVKQFLTVNGYDISNPDELTRLRTLHYRALAFLDETYDLKIPGRIRYSKDPCDLFLAASSTDEANHEEQRCACVVLKIMHVINHLEARRLIHHLSVSERSLFLAAAQKVDEMIRRMQHDGINIVNYEPSTKNDHSLLVKLISKPRVTAAQIFDKLRFRLVTAKREDLAGLMLWLTQHLFPFNHVIAGESHNTILSEKELSAALDAKLENPLPQWVDDDEASRAPNPNPATSNKFHIINFVVELPIRIRRFAKAEDIQRYGHLGHLVLVTLEFQLFDRQTAEANETGAGNHAAYKLRQLQSVSQRLWGDDYPVLKF